ncbi:phospholipase A [Proteobacteria bacterium 005FR1]|nr:phospholipase A [Proteobacteria bacterium 005FR1]
MRSDYLASVTLTALLILLSSPARSEALCHTIEDEAERLACYDAEALLPGQDELTVLTERELGERALLGNRFGILPHRRSYLLPLTYTDDTGGSALPSEDGSDPNESLQHVEMKFQYSLKVPVGGNFLLDDDQLYFAFTQRSLWQAYNRDLSSPFRETLYEPELLWTIPLRQPLFGGRLTAIDLGINHQSNGRSGEFSRSWNRLTFEATWADTDWSLGLRLWQRIEEDAEDDDNPDITDYLGHGELRLGYKWDQYRFTSILRNADGRMSADLSFSWPLNEKLSGFVQFYNGYGETLVDYDNRMRRIGFGFILADWF